MYKGVLRHVVSASVVALLTLCAWSGHALQSVTLAWDPSPDPDITAYNVLYGTVSGDHGSRLTLGNVTQATVNDLEEGVTYYFVVTAENSLGLESLPSNEISYQVPAPVLNTPPVVNAGPDRSITLPATASLAGSVTDDGLPNPPGTTSRTWTKVSGPGTVAFANASAASTTASFSSAGTYVLRLSANDGELASSDEMSVSVTAANLAPIVNAGPDRNITLPATASLAGSVTDDGLPNPPGTTSRTWTKVSGPGTVTFANASAASTTASFSSAGTYVLRLSANDGELSSSDEMSVSVTPANLAPIVNAGPDISITLPGTASLSGSVTDDGLPNPPANTTLIWSTVGGPGTVTFANASSAATTASFSASGSYILRLTANDGASTGSDDINVLVSPNLPPVAVDQSLSVDMNNSLVITLSGSDPNGHAIGYSIMTQPAHGSLSGSAPDLIYTPANNYYGNDSFSFTVSDGYLSSAPAIVSLSVESTLPMVSITASDNLASEPGADTGTFTVSRGGNLEGDIEVDYLISGSALYGTDYEAIPTSVTIPDGSVSVNISLRVWDDLDFEGDEQVTLILSSGSGYSIAIGGNSSATVTIEDNDAPEISITATSVSVQGAGDRSPGPILDEEQLQLHVPGVPGIAYILQYSTNLVDWISLSTNAVGAPMDFIDLNTGYFKSRLYRVTFTDGDVSQAAIVSAAAAGNTSKNIVGVVNVTAAPGMTLIANPLINTQGNDLNTLLPNVPEGTQYFIIGGNNKYRTYKFEGPQKGWWPNGNTALEPGYGAFIRNNTGTNFTVSFVGEVDMTSTQPIPRPGVYSIASFPLPVSADIGNILAVSPLDGDQVVTYRDGQQAITSAYNSSAGGWSPAPPTIQPGESVLYLRN